MELGFFCAAAICLLVGLAWYEYARLGCVSPWPVFLSAYSLQTLATYFFIPYAGSVVGATEVDKIVNSADTALTINLVGLAILLISFYLGRLVLQTQPDPQPLAVLPNSSEPIAIDSRTAYLFSATAAAAALLILGIMFYAGTFPALSDDVVSARTFISDFPELRPFYNLASALGALVLEFFALAICLRFQALPKLPLLALPLLIVALLLTGNRFYLLGLLSGTVSGLSLRWVWKRTGLKLTYPFYLVYLFLFTILSGLSSFAREEGLAQSASLFVANPLIVIIYSALYAYIGNSFSDLRDFAWVLAYFDGEFLGGKTLLAGLAGFLPTVMLPFKEEFLFARVTNQIVGLPTDTHFGLRATLFGEWYLNLDWFGVILLAVLVGVGFSLLQRRFERLTSSLASGQWSVFAIALLFWLSNVVQSIGSTTTLSGLYTQALLLAITYALARSKPVAPLDAQQPEIRP